MIGFIRRNCNEFKNPTNYKYYTTPVRYTLEYGSVF